MVESDFYFLVVTGISSFHHQFSDQHCPFSQNLPFCLLVQICTGTHFYNVRIGCTHNKSRCKFLFQMKIFYYPLAIYYFGHCVDLLECCFGNEKELVKDFDLSDLHLSSEYDLCSSPVCLHFLWSSPCHN